MVARYEAGRMPALDREWNLNAIVGRPFVVAGVMGLRLEREM